MKWVHCDQHGSPHRLDADGTCWCSAVKAPPDYGRHATVLETESEDIIEAAEECRARGLWLYNPKDYEHKVSGG